MPCIAYKERVHQIHLQIRYFHIRCVCISSFQWFLLTRGDIWAFQWANVVFTLMSPLLAQRARIGHNFVQRKELTRIQQLPCYQTRTYSTANVWQSGKWLENSYDFKQERDEFWALRRFYSRTHPWIQRNRTGDILSLILKMLSTSVPLQSTLVYVYETLFCPSLKWQTTSSLPQNQLIQFNADKSRLSFSYWLSCLQKSK